MAKIQQKRVNWIMYNDLKERRQVLRDMRDERKDLLVRERELRKEYVEMETKFYKEVDE